MMQLMPRLTHTHSALALLTLLAPCAAAGSLSDTDDSRLMGSQLRAQPYGAEEPSWLVERADNTSLRISVLSQTRYMFSERKAQFITPGDEKTYGFSQPRTRVALEGSIVSSQFNYRIAFDFGDAELSRGRGNGPFLEGGTGQPRLLDAYAQYNFDGKREGYYLKGGQFGHILLTEEAVAPEYQLAIDRSIASELFGPGYTQGLALGRVSDTIAWEFSITDGGRYIASREADNTSYDDPNEADVALGLRFDWKLKGAWDQFADFTSFQGSNTAAKIGGGVLYQFQGQTNPGENMPPFSTLNAESAQIVTWTLDYQYESDGWNFFAGYYGQWVDWEFPDGTLGTLHNAIVLQGGWFLTDQTELYSRLETFWIDKGYRNGFGVPDGYIHRFLTLGVNHYLLPESHAAKLSFDASYAFDSLFVLSVGGDSLALPDPAVSGFLGLTEHEFVLRLQLQLLF